MPEFWNSLWGGASRQFGPSRQIAGQSSRNAANILQRLKQQQQQQEQFDATLALQRLKEKLKREDDARKGYAKWFEDLRKARTTADQWKIVNNQMDSMGLDPNLKKLYSALGDPKKVAGELFKRLEPKEKDMDKWEWEAERLRTLKSKDVPFEEMDPNDQILWTKYQDVINPSDDDTENETERKRRISIEVDDKIKQGMAFWEAIAEYPASDRDWLLSKRRTLDPEGYAGPQIADDYRDDLESGKLVEHGGVIVPGKEGGFLGFGSTPDDTLSMDEYSKQHPLALKYGIAERQRDIIQPEGADSQLLSQISEALASKVPASSIIDDLMKEHGMSIGEALMLMSRVK